MTMHNSYGSQIFGGHPYGNFGRSESTHPKTNPSSKSKVKKITKEALLLRGWSEAEADQMLSRLVDDSEEKDKNDRS